SHASAHPSSRGFFSSMQRRQPRSTLFPYTTLFRSLEEKYSKISKNGVSILFTVINLRLRRRWLAGLLVFFLFAWPYPAQAEYRRSEEHTSELQSRENLVCRLLLEKKK